VIKHLYRHYAFIHSRMMTDNGGVFVCRTRHLVLAGGSKVSIAQFRCVWNWYISW